MVNWLNLKDVSLEFLVIGSQNGSDLRHSRLSREQQIHSADAASSHNQYCNFDMVVRYSLISLLTSKQNQFLKYTRKSPLPVDFPQYDSAYPCVVPTVLGHTKSGKEHKGPQNPAM